MPEDNNQEPSRIPPQDSFQPEPKAYAPQSTPQSSTPQSQPAPAAYEQLVSVEQEEAAAPRQFDATSSSTPPSAYPAQTPLEPVQTQPQQQEPPRSGASNKKKKIIIASIIAGAILILGVGTYLAYALWYQNPEKVLTDAITNSIKAKTVTYKGTLAVDAKDVKVAVELDGKQNGLVGGEGNAKVTITADGKEFKINGSALGDKDGNLYFKVGNLRTMLDEFLKQLGTETTAFDDLIAKIDNKWIRISADDLAEFSKEASDAQKCSTAALKKLDNDKATREEFAGIYKKNKFVVIDDSLAARSIGGVDSMGYKLSVNQDVAKKFVEAVNDTQLIKDLQKCDNSFKLDASDITKESSSDSTDTFEVSVSRWSHEFTQFKLVSTDKDSTSGTAVIEPLFNKEVTITAPADFLTLKQLQAEIESAMTAIQETAYNGIQDRGEATAAQANANYVIKKAETYNAIESKYPTLAELKGGAIAEAKLSTDISSLLTSAPLSEDSPTLIRYEPCLNTGGYVSYVDVTTGSIVKLIFGICDSSLL